MRYFDDIPCGETIPLKNVHAISVSLPRLSDVIGYEEKDPRIRKKLKSGYPRFVSHPFITKIQQHLRNKFQVSDKREIVLLSSMPAVKRLFDFIDFRYEIISDQNILGVCIPGRSGNLTKIQSFLQHTGSIPSSRLAEQYLIKEGLLVSPYKELLHARGDAQDYIRKIIAHAYEVTDSNDILLGNCGMNTIFAAYRGLQKIQEKNKRDIFIQFGWLYVDTIEIIKKFSSRFIVIESVSSINKVEKILLEKGTEVAAIFTEVTTNPLIQTPDLPALKKLADRYTIPVVIDATFGTPYNVEVVSYSDIVIESLTKFASGNADLLMGALIINKNSNWYYEIKQGAGEFIEKPYIRDVQRLAVEIKGYEARMRKINENTLELTQYLRKSKKVKEIFWPYQERTKKNYLAIQKHRDAAGGIVSLVFSDPLGGIYDKINLPKGPSAGTEFTLLMPYMYLAHYNMVSNSKGRKYLSSVGISPDLLRVSVGVTGIERVIKEFEKVL